ncbi:MAG TPA: ATP-dependent chaperone ClpB, partial [Alphaproteobacteria bacterium]|nr:ATP-dependent chaperone ClpB [Alphaproteobacteria bacterium]
MQTDKFTALVRNAVLAAQNDALAANHQKITAMHLLRALLADDNVTVRSLIGRAGGDLDGLSAALDKALAAIPSVTGSGAEQLQIDMDLARVLQAAEGESKTLG